MSTRQRLVLIGNGMAGIRLLEELLKRAPQAYDITVIGAEPRGCYNRILLSPVLAGEKTVDDIITHPPQWYERQGVRLLSGERVTHIDRAARRLKTGSGLDIGYDRLVLATGSLPFVPPIEGRDRPGVICFRDIDDVQSMLEAARVHRRAVVIGGGVLGLEAACALRLRGMEVTVIHRAAWLMERQLDPQAAQLLQRSLEDRGLEFRLNADTVAVEGAERVQALRFADGDRLETDLVVMSVGITPNARLAREAGLHCERGVVVDDGLLTSDPAIHALGECVQHRGICYGLVAPLYEQAVVLAQQLLGTDPGVRYDGSLLATKLKVTGIDVFSAGRHDGGEHCEDIVYRDARHGIYRRLVVEDGRLVGGVLYGNTADSAWYLDLIQQGAPLGALREHLVFGRELAEAA
ncbi:MAG: FAD-dependent oxidoreductase [Pseudomonadota bacterium]|nr:FAD-dependent oxidoreductase [Pseudomonadota bacterium]